MENFWSTLKIELVYRTSWRTRDEAKNAIFAYIDGWYNTHRIQKNWATSALTSTRPPGTPANTTQPSHLSPPLRQPAAGNHRSIKAGRTHIAEISSIGEVGLIFALVIRFQLLVGYERRPLIWIHQSDPL
ncbi:IS3 family transposase [Polymorphospora lycopeni]|uniref:IS3 family transposase n=1 Tax=Polymorphospora TaxID=338583 RepID=UPI0035D48008